MPLLGIDYVVSFSSEDPDNPASNLLVSDVKSKWLCNKGEPSCSVVLQLKSACKIDTITIGAYHVALIEVLVGLSEKPNDPFQVLVPSSVLLPVQASRRGWPAECVRSFAAPQLAAPAALRRWDRVRLVCSQPYNKHVQFGLSFVHVSGPAPDPAPAPAPRPALSADSASDEEFRPGELFAQHQRASRPASTAAQIRQASSQALRNIPDASTEPTKAPVHKPGGAERGSRRPATRDRTPQTTEKSEAEIPNDASAAPNGGGDDRPRGRAGAGSSGEADSDRAPRPKKKRRRSDKAGGALPLDEVLAGAVVALSGYENPRRAALREAALSMGAQYRRDWQPDCTHLVCAFADTPKMRKARAAGAAAAFVRGEWLERCRAWRRRLPWRWFAAEPAQRLAAPPPFDRAPAEDERLAEADTDDEIERVLGRPGRRASPSPAGGGARAASDPDDTDERERSESPDGAELTQELADVWRGATFVVRGARRALLQRYIRAYGGLVLQEDELLEVGDVQFVVGDDSGDAMGGARRVSPEWVWRNAGHARDKTSSSNVTRKLQ